MPNKQTTAVSRKPKSKGKGDVSPKKKAKKTAKKKTAKKKTAKKKTAKKKAKAIGRPKFEIDFDVVVKLAQMHCTHEEIAAYLGCSSKTLSRDNDFCLAYKKAVDEGKISLRRLQWKLASKGNCTMQIFLGKNILGQSDDPIDMTKQETPNPIRIILHTGDPAKTKPDQPKAETKGDTV